MGSRRRTICTRSLTPFDSFLPSFLSPSSFFSLGYSDEKIARLTKEAVEAGFNHFKMKVGADLADDLRRGRLIRSIIDDPQWQPPHPAGDPESERRRRLLIPADGAGGAGGSAGDDPA